MDEKKLVAKHFGTYNGGYPINGFGYIVDADLNNDGRINGEDHTIASLFSDEAVYDIESFEYDKNGNRTKLVQNGDTYTYQYGDRNRLETVHVKKKDTSTAKLFLKYVYDANGNTIERIAYTDKGEVKTAFEYDTLNRVVKTTEGGKSTEYLYDNAGNRFIKKGPEGTTLYLRHGQTSVAMDIEFGEAGIKGKINRYVLSGELLAGRITRTIKADGTETVDVSYYHLDHLNSTKCVSDEAGIVEVRYVYRAFGSQLAKIGSSEAKYTYGGKELDGENGLYYFNARYYDAEVGRFISVDPAKDGGNWYVYANNNPLRFVDPTGLVINEIIEKSEKLVLDPQAKENNEINYYMGSRRSELNTISYGSGLIGAGMTLLGKFAPIWVKGTVAVAGATNMYTRQQYLNQLSVVTGNISNGTSYQLQKDAVYQTSYEQKWEKGKIVEVENKVLLGHDYKITFDCDANKDGKSDSYHLAEKDYKVFEDMSITKKEIEKK